MRSQEVLAALGSPKKIYSAEDISNYANTFTKEYRSNGELNNFYSLFAEISDDDYKYQFEYDLAKIEYLYSFGEKIEDNIKYYYFKAKIKYIKN